jgi:hypothetical protein
MTTKQVTSKLELLSVQIAVSAKVVNLKISLQKYKIIYFIRHNNPLTKCRIIEYLLAKIVETSLILA